MDSGNSPRRRPPRCGMFFPFTAAAREHLGTSPFPTTPTRNRCYRYRDTSASFGNKSTPFPFITPGRSSSRGSVQRETGGVGAHRRTHLPGRQLEVLPWSARLSREPSLPSCAISCPAPSASSAACRQAEQPAFHQHTQASRAVFSQTLPAAFSGACGGCRCIIPLEIQHQS